MTTLDIIRWIVCAGFAVLWGVVARFNGLTAWREIVTKDRKGPSVLPLFGALLALVSVAACPLGQWQDRWPYLWIPLLLDFGSVPYFLLAFWSLFRDLLATGKHRERL